MTIGKSTLRGVGYVAFLLAATCSGTSTIRGCVGMNRSISSYHALAEDIRGGAVLPECLASDKAEKVVSRALGRNLGPEYSKTARVSIDSYNAESAEGDLGAREKAPVRLAARTFSALEDSERQHATDGQKADWWFTAITMFALGEASESGADGTVFGPGARCAVEALRNACKR